MLYRVCYCAQIQGVVQDVLDGWRWKIVGSSQSGVEAVKSELEELVISIIDN